MDGMLFAVLATTEAAAAGLDVEALGLEAGTVLALNAIVGIVKGYLKDILPDEWETKVKRFMPLLPFVVAIGYSYMIHKELGLAVQIGFKYGLYSMMVYNVWRTSVEGRSSKAPSLGANAIQPENPTVK